MLEVKHFTRMWREAMAADRWAYGVIGIEIAIAIYLIWSLI